MNRVIELLENFTTKWVIHFYIGYFIALALVVLLATHQQSDFSSYFDIVNYIAIFAITLTIGIFNYLSLLDKRSITYKKLALHAQVMFVSTILFVISLIFLPAKEVLQNSEISILGLIINGVSSVGVFVCPILFSASLVELIIIFIGNIYSSISQMSPHLAIISRQIPH